MCQNRQTYTLFGTPVKSLFVYIELKHGAMHAILGTIMIYNHTNAFLINNAGPARAFSSPLASAHAKLHTGQVVGGPLRGGVRGRPSARGAVSVSINPLCLWTRSLASECVTGPVVRIWFFDRYTSISYNCRRISAISRPGVKDSRAWRRPLPRSAATPGPPGGRRDDRP